MKQRLPYKKSSGNIYKDIGFKDSEEQRAKADLAIRIENIIREKQLKQIDAAELLGITQPKISALMNGQLSGFSMEKLISYLKMLDQDVQIIVKPKSKNRKRHGCLQVACI